jgi:methylmalonyl-CoA mutase, N-terminal domain
MTPNSGAGKYPFTRGIYGEMYKSRLWTMRQYAGFSTAEDSNKRYQYLLESGTTGLSVAFDLPTQIGYDSDHEFAEGEVGKVGVPISSIADMEILFKDIPLDKVSTSMTINSTASILLAFYIVVAEKQGVPKEKLTGTIQNDILKEYIARGTYIFPPEPSLRIVTDIIEYCSKYLPKFNTISISGYHIREAGSTAAQELAFTFANGIAYVESAIKAGLDVNTFGKRLSFFWNAHNDFLEEIAKFRTSRTIWAKIMKERFGATDPKAMMCRFHTQTGGSTLTAQQIENNTVRVALQAMAAVLGGTQSLHTNSRDEALALPSEDSVRLALRTQQIIAHESGVTQYVDPLAGSEVIENLCTKLETQVWDYLKQIDELGGAVSAIESGFFHHEISSSSYSDQKAIESGESIIVGMNKFQVKEETDPQLLKLDLHATERQIHRLKDFKINRDSQNLDQKLAQIKHVASSSENLMPAIIEAVRSGATIGEISDTLRDVFGEYKG